MTRTPEEVFAHHAQALGAGDLDGSDSRSRSTYFMTFPEPVPGSVSARLQILGTLCEASRCRQKASSSSETGARIRSTSPACSPQ